MRESSLANYNAGLRSSEIGLKNEDKIIVVGKDFLDLYWARLAKVKIVGEIQNSESFWTLENKQFEDFLCQLKETGIKAVVTSKTTPQGNNARWLEINAGDSYAVFTECSP